MSEEKEIGSLACALITAMRESFQGETSLHYESNLPTAITEVAKAIYRLGNADASTPMGGLEALGKAILDSADRIAVSISNLADAIREVGASISEDEPLNYSVSRGLDKIAERS